MDSAIRDVPAAALAFESVSFDYGRHQVVRDVSFQLAAGEMVALLGPNGAGKSTLLRLGAGTLLPAVGAVRLHGDNLRRLPRREVARRLAVAPQDFSVQFAYTVRQVVELGRTPYQDMFSLPGRGDAHAVEAALVAAGVEHLANRTFNDLSGGERQRVLIALTLAQEAPVLLLDEPTAHLDIRYQVEVLELLRHLNEDRKLTVLAALHDLNLAARYFPRLLLFRQTIVADGPPARVLDTELLSQVYETRVRVGIVRGEEHLTVLPPSQGGPLVSHSGRASVSDTAVHVVGGGGSAELMMRALADAGISFSAGPLNAGDSDYTLAQRLADSCIVEPPYAPVSAEGVIAARMRLLAARAVILCPIPLGAGNIALIEETLAACRAGRRVVLLEPGVNGEGDREALLANVGMRDFTTKGVELYRDLMAAGCSVASSVTQALQLLG